MAGGLPTLKQPSPAAMNLELRVDGAHSGQRHWVTAGTQGPPGAGGREEQQGVTRGHPGHAQGARPAPLQPGRCPLRVPQDTPTSPIRYLRLPHGIRGSCCWKALVKYVFRISMQTLKEEEQAWLYSNPQSHPHPSPLRMWQGQLGCRRLRATGRRGRDKPLAGRVLRGCSRRCALTWKSHSLKS